MYHKTMLLCFGWLVAGAVTLLAQDVPPAESEPPFESFPGLEDPFGMPGSGFMGPQVEFSGFFQVQEGSRDGKLSVRAEINPGWHVYSITQPGGGPRPTTISVEPNPDCELRGEFQSDRDPYVTTDAAFPGVRIEEYSDQVTWSAPIRLAEGVDPTSLQISVRINGQVCETGGSCTLINNEPVTATFAGYAQAKSATGTYNPPGGHVTLAGHLEPQVAAPGDTVKLVLTANLQPSWHVYRLEEKDPNKVSKPTLITLRKVAGWEYDSPEASVEPTAEESGLEEEPVLYYHEDTVTWTISISVPDDAKPGDYPIAGGIAFQACTANACDQPSAANFEAAVTVGTQATPGRVPLAFAAAKYADMAEEAESLASQKSASPQQYEKSELDSMPLFYVLGIAFLAGLILNVMPCVLPVIGLKIMSFVHQAGGSRGEILALNLWFSLGLMSVFWILGAAAAFAGHTWGEHFSDMRFLIAMIGIVFAFGLSFLGVWEIPIPGFVGSGTLQGTAAKEGAIGAFSKGVLSTILATPCAGPLIGPAVGWAIKQPEWLTFAAFTCIGLGMAAPYLLVGAMPRLVNLLPKPGAWMEIFKQVMGFVLMGTVVFLFLSVPADYVVPTLILLLGIAVACWLLGITPGGSALSLKAMSWSAAAGMIVMSALLGFVALSPGEGINWQPFTRVALDQHLAEGNTVMVDFTANW
jgi:thiol:disulfide interchange protein